MADYNPFYDNQFDNNHQINSQQDRRNNKSNSFQIGAQNMLREQKPANEILQQIQEKEKLKKQKQQEQWEYERKIAAQPVAYLQSSGNQYSNKPKISRQNYDQQAHYQPQSNYQTNYTPQPQDQSFKQERYLLQKKKNNSQVEDNQHQNAQGGVFASVFDIKEARQNEKQRVQQSYAEEIQRQIEEKRLKKQEDERKKFEEDILYEEKIKRELEEINRRNQQEIDKKQNEMKGLPRVQDQKKAEQSRFEKQNKTNKTEQYSRFLNEIQNDTQNEPMPAENQPQQQDGNVSYNNISMTIPINNISQNNIIPQFIQDADERFELQQRETSNFPADPQYPQSRKSTQRTYPAQNQNLNNFPQNRYAYSLENYMKQYQELQAENRQRNIIQEEDMKSLRFQLEQQVNVLNNELVKLRAEEQMSIENKRNAYMDLENLKDQLRRQEYEEKIRLDNIKKNYGYQPTILTYSQPNRTNVARIEEAQKSKITFETQDLNIDLDQDGNQKFIPLNSEAKYFGIPTQTENLIESKLSKYQQDQINNTIYSDLK